jgi:hypothetical protein
MREFLEKVSVPCFYGFILFLQPVAAFLIGRFFTARQFMYKRRLLGWLGGLVIFAAVFLLGWWGTQARVEFSRMQCGDYPLCCEYCGLAIVFDAISGIGSLLIFLATAGLSIRMEKNRAEADSLNDG